jgi:hypothetical protein
VSRALAPKRPIVVIQSDDWGRVGVPGIEALERVKAAGANVGASGWDRYGLETAGDLESLGELLASFADRDGNAPCMTANFVMANADFSRMREERYASFRWIAITDGFPEPWNENLMPAYRDLIRCNLFEPALHGFTHFNTQVMMACLREDSDRGRRARLLAENDIPYLASYTPEYNFALTIRDGDERFMDDDYQSSWVATGARLFTEAFGHRPLTACAPGYRSNDVTQRLWRDAGIESLQTVGPRAISMTAGAVRVERNVAFEPVLGGGDVVARAMDAVRRAVRRGAPIVICSHSINYITRFTAGAERGRALLKTFLRAMLDEFPDLRFANTRSLVDAWKAADEGWFSEPSLAQRFRRIGAA